MCPEHLETARASAAIRVAHGLPICKTDKCSELAENYSKCRTHFKSGSESDLPNGSACLVPGCDSTGIGGSGICSAHRKISRRYNIGMKRLTEIFTDPSCGVCGTGQGLSIDHDHSCCPQAYGTCGKCNRGLLCKDCNWAIGAMKDSPQLLERAAGYLREGSRI